MKRLLLFITIPLLYALSTQAQEITLDTTGRIYDLKLNKKNEHHFSVAIKGELKARRMQQQMEAFFVEKIDSTIYHLTEVNSIYYDYFKTGMWTGTKHDEVVQDLLQINAWIKQKTPVTNLKHLGPFYARLKKLLETQDDKDWFLVNNLPMGPTIALTQTDFQVATDAYVIEVKAKQLFNQFVTDLFNDTYSIGGNQLATMPPAAFAAEDQTLNSLLVQVKALSKQVNDMTQTDLDNFAPLHAAIRADAVVDAIRTAPYIANWIWLRKGEPTFNPFEIRAKDTITTTPQTPLKRSANVSLLNKVIVETELLNRIQFSKGKLADTRNIHFFRLGNDEVKSMLKEIKEPVRGDENVRVNMHNTLQPEQLILQITKSTPHSGKNTTMDNVDAAVGILATAYASFNPALSWLTPLFSTSGVNKSAAEFNRLSNTLTEADLQTTLSDIHQELATQGRLNENLFTTTKADAILVQFITSNNMMQYAKAFLASYNTVYDKFVKTRNLLKADSVVVAQTLDIVLESNLPPATVQMKNVPTLPVYRTEILSTGEVDEDNTTEYAVKRLLKKAGNSDSATVANFKIKTGKLKYMMVSAGIMFTIPSRYYAENTFTPGTETAGTKIETTRKNTSFVVGLNIYIKPINMLDNHWGWSKECKPLSRLSVYIGLDVPNVMDHFYPGVSYDLIPGLKLTGGAHLYRHTRYSISNNVVKDENRVLRAAGPFIGLSIDTNTILSVINIFKKG